MEHDVLLVHAPLDQIRLIQETEGIRLRSEVKVELGDLVAGGMVLAEAVVPPGSPLENRSLKQASFRNKYGVTALALYHRRETIRERVGRVPLRTGDILLLYGSKARLRQLAGFPEVLSLVKILPPRPRRHRALSSVLILGITVLVAASGAVSLVTAAVAGAAIMVVSGCLSLRETYRAIDRRTIFLLAGMISLGLTMERSGAADRLAYWVMDHASGLGPWALLVATYVTTALLTELLTNNACAVIMTPIAIVAARDFGFDPRPFAFAVAYAASASFLTPWGYQTNLFVYGPGGYRFADFPRMGLPLSLITGLLACLAIPWIWPLVPAP
jgi:di/tricarboxylate transporter